MDYTTLGSTGMEVSRIGLGGVSFGSAEPWMLDDSASREIIDRAIDLGINFFDTANAYSTGESERILGSALADYNRDRLVVATKCFFQMDPDNPNSRGLSRKAVEQELANSLERLGMETVDLYQTHRWDSRLPTSAVLRTLDDAVRRGQVRYLGASTMRAYEFAEALHTADRIGLDRFATMQNHYNLVYREEEREMLPLCQREGVGVIPWSPLARGYLARPDAALRDTERGRTDPYLDRRIAAYRANGGVTINDRIVELADAYDASMAQIALAWLLAKEWVDAPVVSISRLEHLEEAVEAVDISLADDDVRYLEQPYEAGEEIGFTSAMI
ncbi:MAG: aldo/keto reductase [Halobacteriales archaeon]|nr:aldo/keto reductase [Halobacteriales archaeon]